MTYQFDLEMNQLRPSDCKTKFFLLGVQKTTTFLYTFSNVYLFKSNLKMKIGLIQFDLKKSKIYNEI